MNGSGNFPSNINSNMEYFLDDNYFMDSSHSQENKSEYLTAMIRDYNRSVPDTPRSNTPVADATIRGQNENTEHENIVTGSTWSSEDTDTAKDTPRKTQ